jgi:hypothetical protein
MNISDQDAVAEVTNCTIALCCISSPREEKLFLSCYLSVRLCALSSQWYL